MIETKPRINRGNRGQLFRATWLSSARCSETFRRTTERVEGLKQRIVHGRRPSNINCSTIVLTVSSITSPSINYGTTHRKPEYLEMRRTYAQ